MWKAFKEGRNLWNGNAKSTPTPTQKIVDPKLDQTLKDRIDPDKVLKYTPESGESLYHYTTPEKANTIIKSQLGANPGDIIYLTPEGNLTPLQVQIELALPPNRGLPTSVLEISPQAIDPQKIILQRNVTGNVLGGGGGYEVLYPAPIDSKYIKPVK